MGTHSGVVNNPPIAKHYASEFLVIAGGKGARLKDISGKDYLDFAGGIAVNAFGYGREDFAEIAYEQMKKLVHVSNLYSTEPALELAAKMVASGPFQAVSFANSGSEANEAAIKFARLYAYRTKGAGHHKILCFRNGFHGRTLGALSCTPNPKYQEPFAPLIPGVDVAPYNDAKSVETKLDRDYAAVIVEVVQGEGGLEVMSREFAQKLSDLCRRHGIILIADEVQTGMGRTGTLYASDDVMLKPDIISVAKPLAGGLPLSAVLLPAKVNELLHVGEHGTTFGGGPVTTAVANRVWDLVNAPGFLDEVRRKGTILGDLLQRLVQKYSFLGSVKGKGMLRGIELDVDKAQYAESLRVLSTACQAAGLLVLRSGENVLRFAPPLVIREDELAEGAGILDDVFTAYAEKHQQGDISAEG